MKNLGDILVHHKCHCAATYGTGIGGKYMDRMKYRIWLISIVLVAVVFGIFYYAYVRNQEKTVTDGTLVYRMDQIGRAHV